MKNQTTSAVPERVTPYDLIASKYDGRVYRIFQNNILLCEDEEKTIFFSPCGSPFFNVKTQHSRVSPCDELIVMMKKEYFNIVILLHGDTLREYYINLTMMPDAASNNAIKYVDMDIDLSFTSDNRKVAVLDQDEFEQNALIYGYSEYDMHAIHSTVQDLITMVADDHYYFSDRFVTDCKALLDGCI